MRRTLLVVAGVGLLGAGIWFLRAGKPPPSDEDLIRTVFLEGARAIEERRVGDAMEGVSETFQGEGLDKKGVHRVIAAFTLRGEWVSVAVTGDRIEIRGNEADAVVDVVAANSGKGKGLAELMPADASAHRLRCKLRREEKGWKIFAADRRSISLAQAMEGPPGATAP
jgi:hypothetical protein